LESAGKNFFTGGWAARAIEQTSIVMAMRMKIVFSMVTPLGW